MRYPEYLQENGTIGFAAPSFGCATEPYKSCFEHALSQFEKLGYQCKTGPNCYADDGIGISTSPEKCGKEIMEVFADPEMDVIISCGGGELMCEILDHVDFEKLKKLTPKWFMGYSDNTNLTFLLTTICDTAAIYGPCASSFGMEPWHPAIQDALLVLTGKKQTVKGYGMWEKESDKNETNPFAPYNLTESLNLHLYEGKRKLKENESLSMKGRLVGGCMDCLGNLVGTKFDQVKQFNEKYKEEGIIWFLESCELNVFDMRRKLWQMEEAGWFENAAGFILGRPMLFGQEMMGLDQYSAVLGILGKKNVPIIMDCDIGHLPPMMPLISGSLAEITAVNNEISVSMK